MLQLFIFGTNGSIDEKNDRISVSVLHFELKPLFLSFFKIYIARTEHQVLEKQEALFPKHRRNENSHKNLDNQTGRLKTILTKYNQNSKQKKDQKSICSVCLAKFS